MLTPTDTHYVAGLLTLCSSPIGVEVEVGSVVMDTAAEEGRDVDVTINGRDADGRPVILMGREVKANRRPLDSTHVEQLAQKMKDMPALAGRGIVSASGYRRPAIRKAKKHGIVLYELVELSESGAAFDHVRLTRAPVIQTGLEWVGHVNARVNPRQGITPAEKAAFDANPPIVLAGKRDAQCRNLRKFVALMRKEVLHELMKEWPSEGKVHGLAKHVRIMHHVASFKAVIKSKALTMPIEEIVFDGTARWREEESESRLMVLRVVGSEKPDAGCCVFEMPSWGLCGLVVSNTNREIRFLTIPVTDRKKKKIYRQMLHHIGPANASIFLPSVEQAVGQAVTT